MAAINSTTKNPAKKNIEEATRSASASSSQESVVLLETRNAEGEEKILDIARSVMLTGFPAEYTENDVEDFCASYGIVTNVVAQTVEEEEKEEKGGGEDSKADEAEKGKEDDEEISSVDKKEETEERAEDPAEEEPPSPPSHDKKRIFKVEFCSHLDAREFLFHVTTFEGIGVQATPLWTEMSRFARGAALDFGCMQRLETFFYRHRGEEPRSTKTRKIEPKQIYVHGDYKSVGFQTVIDYMKRFGRVVRMQELTGLYEGLVISFDSTSPVKTLTQNHIDHVIGRRKFKTRPFFMTKNVKHEPTVDVSSIWVQGQVYQVPDFTEMSFDWMSRYKSGDDGALEEPETDSTTDWPMLTSENHSAGALADAELERFITPTTLVHLVPRDGILPVLPVKDYRIRVWEGRGIVVTGFGELAPKDLEIFFTSFGAIEHLQVIRKPPINSHPEALEKVGVAIIIFRQSSFAEDALENEHHWIGDRRLRVRRHTNSPSRVLAVISATPGAEGLPQAWNTGSDINQVTMYFKRFGRVDFMMYRRTGLKENEPTIVFQLSTFEQVDEIMHFKHNVLGKTVVLKQVKRIPATGPIQLVNENHEPETAKVSSLIEIKGPRFPPPTATWWTKELVKVAALRKAKRDSGKTGEAQLEVEEPVAKKKRASAPENDKPEMRASASAPVAKPAPVATTTPKVAPSATPVATVPLVRERFVNQPRDVSTVPATDIAYLHVYATKAKDSKTREKFSAVEARSYFEGFGKIKAFWSKKQVMSYVEFAYFDPEVHKRVALDSKLSIMSLPPASSKLHFTAFPIFQAELDLIPWPVGLHKTKESWLNLTPPEEQNLVAINSDEEPKPPGDDNPVSRVVVRPPVRKSPTPLDSSSGINAFGDSRVQDEEEETLTEEDEKKLRAKLLLAAALKKRQADDAAGEGGDAASGSGKAKRTIYVRGFRDDPTQNAKVDLFRFFKQIGKVSSVNLGYSKEQGLQYTWACIEFEEDAIIKDLTRSNLFLEGYPLQIVRKKENWDQDVGPSKLIPSTWRHAYVTGLDSSTEVDDVQRFFNAKVGGIKKVDSRVVNELSIFLIEFESPSFCQRAVKGGGTTFINKREVYTWPPYIYEDLCVRKQTFDQQLAALQSLSEVPTRKVIYSFLAVQKMETQLKTIFSECTLKLVGNNLTKLLPSSDLNVYFEFTEADSTSYRDNKAPKITLDDLREKDIAICELAKLPTLSRLQLLSSALEELGIGEEYKVLPPTTKRKGRLRFKHLAAGIECNISVVRCPEMERTALLQLMQQYDARFAPLYFGFRHFLQSWSRTDSRVTTMAERTLPDIVILIMTIVFLQQVNPPVLPSIRDLEGMREETKMVDGWNCAAGDVPIGEIPRSQTNDSSLWTLFRELVRFYARFDFENFVLSPYYGRAVPFSLMLSVHAGHEELFKVGRINVQDVFVLNRNLTLDTKVLMRDSVATACSKAYSVLSSSSADDSSLRRHVVWGYPTILNDLLLLRATSIADSTHTMDRLILPLVDLETPFFDPPPKKDLHITEYIYMIKDQVPPTILPVIESGNNRVWFHHVCFLVYRALCYSLLVHCKIVESRYSLSTEDALRAPFDDAAEAESEGSDEAIKKVAEFWCFTPVKLRKNYSSYWTSSGKNAPSKPSTAWEMSLLQTLYREVHRKSHACFHPVCFRIVMEQMNTAQPAVKLTITGEHVNKPLFDFLKDYLPKLVHVQYKEMFN